MVAEPSSPETCATQAGKSKKLYTPPRVVTSPFLVPAKFTPSRLVNVGQFFTRYARYSIIYIFTSFAALKSVFKPNY